MSSPYYQTAHWRALRKQCLERDRYRCSTPHCPRPGRVDHIETRPNVPTPTALDVLSNLRTLCRSCDAQIKERGPDGKRNRGGVARVRGCDVNGWPLGKTE